MLVGEWVYKRVRTIGRAAAAGRPEARSAVGHLGLGLGRSCLRPSFRIGLGGITPEKMLKLDIAKDCSTSAIQAEQESDSQLSWKKLRNLSSKIKITTKMKECWRIRWKHCLNVRHKTFMHSQTIARLCYILKHATHYTNSICQSMLNCWLLSVTLSIKPSHLNVHYTHSSVTIVIVSNDQPDHVI